MDLEKVFDSVLSYFVEQILTVFNFKATINNLVKTLYNNLMFCILQTWFLSETFKLKRGWRPLTYLFYVLKYCPFLWEILKILRYINRRNWISNIAICKRCKLFIRWIIRLPGKYTKNIRLLSKYWSLKISIIQTLR